MDEIVVKILDKLNLYWDDPIRVSRKPLPPMCCGDFIKHILEGASGPRLAVIWGVGVQTVNRTVADKLTPYIGKATGGGESLQFLLLKLVEYKHCLVCKKILHFSHFGKDRTTSTGRDNKCKICKSEFNRTQYLKESTKLAHARSYTKNYYKILERNNLYKGERSLRVPKWSETELIEEFYKNCPDGYHVDHILPLKGELVSGLHVISNLQYLTAEDNLAKGNKVDLEAYNNK